MRYMNSRTIINDMGILETSVGDLIMETRIERGVLSGIHGFILFRSSHTRKVLLKYSRGVIYHNNDRVDQTDFDGAPKKWSPKESRS